MSDLTTGFRKTVTVGPGLSVQMLRGISDFARENHWLLNMAPWRKDDASRPLWTGDGIIASLQARPELSENIRASGLPLVNIADQPFDGVTTIMPDHRWAGRMAAEYFLQRGYHNLAWASSAPSRPCQEMMSAFQEVVAGADRVFHRIDIGPNVLAGMPVPLGVLACSDADAVALENVALEAGISIPEELAIIGPGNEPYWSDLAPVPLSQVDADHQQMGYQAAGALRGLMSGAAQGGFLPPVRPKCVCTRRSSDCVAIPHREAAAAITFIWKHFRDAITPGRVAREIGLTRQRLDAVLKQHTGRTLAGEIEHKRMELAMAMLRDGQDKVRIIADQCGFTNSLSLNRAFRRTLGMPPQQWRAQNFHVAAAAAEMAQTPLSI
ncbi:MAG: substrate-binding domain-containing protein [Planctomycetaceae bacterium]|nr:substrate-binding domain-containing protein [Planctomycetaceae bacterium]